jgi:hypothetical protein
MPFTAAVEDFSGHTILRHTPKKKKKSRSPAVEAAVLELNRVCIYIYIYIFFFFLLVFLFPVCVLMRLCWVAIGNFEILCVIYGIFIDGAKKK